MDAHSLSRQGVGEVRRDLRVPRRDKPRRWQCSLARFTSRVNSSSIPARPSASSDFAAHSSNSTISTAPYPAGRPSRSCWSRTMGRSRQQAALAALAARAHWAHRRVAAQIPPELNDIEVVWHDLKAHSHSPSDFTDIALSTKPSTPRRRPQPRAYGRPVGQAANLCFRRPVRRSRPRDESGPAAGAQRARRARGAAIAPVVNGARGRLDSSSACARARARRSRRRRERGRATRSPPCRATISGVWMTNRLSMPRLSATCRLQRIVAAVGIAGVSGLAHAGTRCLSARP